MKNINEMTMDELTEYAVALDWWEWLDGIEGRLTADLAHHSTVGCVMAMVRAKYGPNTWTVYTPRGWQVMTSEHTVTVNEFAELVGGDMQVTGQVVFRPRAIIMASEEMPTEIHALIAALAKELP